MRQKKNFPFTLVNFMNVSHDYRYVLKGGISQGLFQMMERRHYLWMKQSLTQ